VLPVKLVQVA